MQKNRVAHPSDLLLIKGLDLHKVFQEIRVNTKPRV